MSVSYYEFFLMFDHSTWCCCKIFICSHKKCLSFLGAASFLIFPFGFYLYHFLKPQSKKQFWPENLDNENPQKNLTDLKKSMMNSFPIIYNFDRTIHVLTIKKIYYLTVIFCQEDLISIRRKIFLLRRKIFFNLEKYIELTIHLYNEYYNILENSLQTLLQLRQIDRKIFERSVLVNEQKEILRKGFLRDAAFSILSEKNGNSLKISRAKMKEYILTQIKDLKGQKKIFDIFFFNAKSANIKKIILSNRADDLAFESLGIEDLDYVRNLKYYIKDEEINKLINERNEILSH